MKKTNYQMQVKQGKKYECERTHTWNILVDPMMYMACLVWVNAKWTTSICHRI